MGKVVKVTDGDTITILTSDNEQERVRLYGIDAPEASGGPQQASTRQGVRIGAGASLGGESSLGRFPKTYFEYA